ncbi:copper resistance protein NlpE [Flavobacterium branchiicola]|uniref:Copper resistance protein NlpE n=1 Tax=Flavobacterium branchiicola TaxID=1114875 RepID=A0ABV9PD97_9FLAO|nr:copper resistance protein NlpE [Flavobacterium branchiicola]MBS7254254.1 copper resistance protein NlpE N-terminal domain-containing protein [Flavobacterium branchiicola]
MKKILILLAVITLLVSCNSKNKQEENNEIIATDTISTEVEDDTITAVSIFEGTLPCADCSGIETVLKIDSKTNKFELSSIYSGKKSEKQFTQKGNFNTERGLEKDIDGTIYILNWDKPESEQVYYGYYSKNPEKLFMLDSHKKVIKSKLNYFLELNE